MQPSPQRTFCPDCGRRGAGFRGPWLCRGCLEERAQRIWEATQKKEPKS